MTKTEHYEPHGQSLLDYLHGEAQAVITVHSDGGQRTDVPVQLFFREPDHFPLELQAIELCRGRVLDIGAGAGCHTLALQTRGLEVVAIDFLSECVEVMRARGVRAAQQGDIHTFTAEPFDTLLSLMNGLALVRDLCGLQPFLTRLRHLLKPGGQFLVDSCDLRRTGRPQSQATIEARRHDGRYFGESDLQLEYKGRRGAPFTQLCVDAATLNAHAQAAGWSCEIVVQEATVRYLARLEQQG
ncbi:MAG TPA: class I SAM-dependent methyltransferase [Pyrinomonadaceae bacterium]|nr:class I SAM-dependent methyltransferase [Pyrinomonadaceae bacterium]